MRVSNRKLVVGRGVTLCLKLLFKCSNLGLGILEAGVGELAEVVHGFIDQVMDFCFLQLVGVWISNCDALLVTVCCCYIIKVNVLITKFDGKVMKNMDSLMLRANTIDVNFPLAKARRFQLDHPMYAN